MQPLTGCSENLVVLIETQFRTAPNSWDWFYSIVKSVSIRMANEPQSHPIPFGTEITDNVNRQMDEITITGVFGCLSCEDTDVEPEEVIPEIKRLSRRMICNIDEYVTLTSNHWAARYMILVGASIEENQDSVQTLSLIHI